MRCKRLVPDLPGLQKQRRLQRFPKTFSRFASLRFGVLVLFRFVFLSLKRKINSVSEIFFPVQGEESQRKEIQVNDHLAKHVT